MTKLEKALEWLSFLVGVWLFTKYFPMLVT